MGRNGLVERVDPAQRKPQAWPNLGRRAVSVTLGNVSVVQRDTWTVDQGVGHTSQWQSVSLSFFFWILSVSLFFFSFLKQLYVGLVTRHLSPRPHHSTLAHRPRISSSTSPWEEVPPVLACWPNVASISLTCGPEFH
jgi:hypothetical protein